MFRWLCLLYARLTGWKVDVESYTYLPKALVVQAPHTSSWDFPIGIFVRKELDQNIQFLGKSSLFKWPFGGLFRSMGGYPVDRSGNKNFVDAAVEIINKHDKFLLHISPEGTRKKVDKIKSGWYYIAKGAKVPIIMSKFDWENKIVSFSPPFYISEHYEKDVEHLVAFFKGTKGKVPEYSWPG